MLHKAIRLRKPGFECSIIVKNNDFFCENVNAKKFYLIFKLHFLGAKLIFSSDFRVCVNNTKVNYTKNKTNTISKYYI